MDQKGEKNPVQLIGGQFQDSEWMPHQTVEKKKFLWVLAQLTCLWF